RVEQRRLAGAVWTDDADDLAGAARQRDAVERFHAPEDYAQSFDRDHRRTTFAAIDARPPGSTIENASNNAASTATRYDLSDGTPIHSAPRSAEPMTGPRALPAPPTTTAASALT